MDGARDNATDASPDKSHDTGRELRILRKKLDKARRTQAELENLMDASHTFQRNIIKEVEASRAEIETKSRELEQAYASLQAEQARTDQLLRSIMPDDVAAELKSTGRVQPRRVESATVMFADFVAFSAATERLDPVALVEMLDHYYSAFDRIIAGHGVEKVKTIGDAYMCVAGMRPGDDASHARHMLGAAREILMFVRDARARPGKWPRMWDVRIGLNSGPLSGGIVGHDRLSYDIWGNTVNTAARVVKACAPNTITLSQSTRDLLGGDPALHALGAVEAKGIGDVTVYRFEI
ncbi:adenylate/guanylate cyclase domain-containing protein [Meridianimarinicoccus sp. RP-17]|uniref:adenylate/guanylate cyclase domain-containing protein n=1 Tax=Meridianimarinicoccus zhengii TaxID=2056810 RepID=UPI000DAE22F6|nr:adenylate/guanylate cyclase domain-containing protein [Phycocomes zhengii]